jgi:hypothetical protein
MHRSRSHHPVIRFYDDAGNVIETHEYAGGFQRALAALPIVQELLAVRICSIAATNEVQEWAEASVTAWTVV